MLRCCFLLVTLLAVGTPGPISGLRADDKKAWEEAELKKLAGRWTTVREEKADGKARRRRLDLEFAGGELKVFVFDENDAKIWEGPPLKVIGAELVGRGLTGRLNLDKGEVYYDFVGEKLIVVGGIGPRPWEGFQLSGEYRRGEKPK
jgi:hypothetical protein